MNLQRLQRLMLLIFYLQVVGVEPKKRRVYGLGTHASTFYPDFVSSSSSASSHYNTLFDEWLREELQEIQENLHRKNEEIQQKNEEMQKQIEEMKKKKKEERLKREDDVRTEKIPNFLKKGKIVILAENPEFF